MRNNALLIVLLLIVAGVALVSAGSVVHDTVDDAELAEASGLASSLLTPGILYTHNDSGGAPTVYTLNRRGLVPAKINLQGVSNRDWEDIAVARDPRTQKPCVYVGDIGDNSARYKSVFVYRFEEIPLEDTLMSVSRIDKYEIAYEDGPRDAEALLVDPRSGDICIISKREEQVGVYLVPYPQSTDKVNQAKKTLLTEKTAASLVRKIRKSGLQPELAIDFIRSHAPGAYQADYIDMWNSFLQDSAKTLGSDMDYQMHDALALLRRECHVAG